MAKGSLANCIPDLQIEWATSCPTHSIRDFLITKKGYTERQYRSIVSRAPKAEWSVRREEIQNGIAANKIQKFIDEASEIHVQYLKASRLALARSVKILATDDFMSGKFKSSDLLNCVKAIEGSQRIFLQAMGTPETGIIQINDKVTRNEEAKRPVSRVARDDRELKERLSCLTYEEIRILIERKRELKQESVVQNS